MKLAGGFFFVLLILIACNYEPETSEVTVNGKIRLVIPTSLKLSPSPNPNALLHYEDTMHSLYLMVIAESKDSMKAYEMDHNLNTYFDESCQDLNSRLSGGVIFGLGPKKINGADAFTGNIKGSSGKEKIMYSIAAIETKKNFYQVVAAYPLEDSARWNPVMNAVILSFREL